MEKRYQQQDVSILLNKASFLNPRFKSLAHLSAAYQEEVVDSLLDETVLSSTSTNQPSLTNRQSTSDVTTGGGPPAKKQKCALEKLHMYLVTNSWGRRPEQVQAEISRYKAEPAL